METPKSLGSFHGRADRKMEVQGQGSEEVLQRRCQQPWERRTGKWEVGLEGSWPREEGDWWPWGESRAWKRSSQAEGLRMQAGVAGAFIFTFLV